MKLLKKLQKFCVNCSMHLNIQINNQNFILHATGAIYWPEQEILLIADVHLGKVSHFRKFGSAVPLSAINSNFAKLDQLLKTFDPEHIIFLGDLFHSSLNNEWKLFEKWVWDTDQKIHLVAGNHDIISPLKYESLGIRIHSEIVIDNFHFTHHPQENPEYFNFCGHIHPGYRFYGMGKQSLKLRCFFKREDQMILPAFGEFTGNYFMKPDEGEKVFVITGKEVILIA